MAEQIRSFWSHLCGIFGAIFGMIAGGTLVTIERAGAVGSPNCIFSSSYSKETLSNGAVVFSCYGGGWFCGKATSSSAGPWYTMQCAGVNPCYVMDGNNNWPRYYAYFMGCADGYYSTEGIGYKTDVTATVASSGVGVQLHQNLTTFSNFYPVIGLDPYRSFASGNCTYWEGATVGTSGDKVYVLPGHTGLPSGYDIDLDSATAGRCEKCPAYDEVYNDYPAKSLSASTSTYAKAITSCFMSANTNRSDAVEYDGNATGRFIWTQSCMYGGSEPEPNPWADCEAMNGSGNCTITLDDRGSNSIEVIKVVRSVTGLGLKEAKAIVDSSPTTIIEDFSCTAANCYKPYFEEKGARITITQDSSSSSGGTTGGDEASCESMKASGDCSIMLDSVGANKLAVITVVKSVTGLGTKDAKTLVESAPVMVIEDFSCEAAECYKTMFEEEGADVTITEQ